MDRERERLILTSKCPYYYTRNGLPKYVIDIYIFMVELLEQYKGQIFGLY